MTTENASIRVTIDKRTKILAANALEDMGLTISDVVRILLRRVGRDKCIPFDIKVPSAATREAMRDLEEGRYKTFNTVEELMADLNADD